MPGVPWTLPPLAPDAEISEELFSHCSQPLFTSAELQEWHDTLDQHRTDAMASPHAVPTLFDSLTPHASASQLTDNALTCFQTRVQVAHRRHPQDAQHFVFTPGLWVAIRPSEDETLEQFWIAKITAVRRTNLVVRWWQRHRDHWQDHGSSGSVAHNTVLACGFNFDPKKGVDHDTLKEIYARR